MSTPRWCLFVKGLSSAQTRTAQLLSVVALLSSCAYSQSPSFIVNAYYGASNGTTPLSSLIASGATSRLTHLTYAFATSDENSNPCTGAPTAMTLSDLMALKAQNPNLKILISVGGSDQYGVFVNALPTAAEEPDPDKTSTFANACVTTLMTSFPGYIDGIDIDWEFPQNTTDEQNFNTMLADFRSALDSYAAKNGITEHLLLTAAIGPESTTNGWQFVDFTGQQYTPGANKSVDFYNVEFYNYAYDSDPITQSNAPIHDINDDIYGNTSAYGAAGLIPVGGVPASMIVVGIPFYGVHYTGVSAGTQLGGSGTLVSTQTLAGTPTYSQIAAMIAAKPAVYQNFSDTDGSAWTWDDVVGDSLYQNFWEYDNSTTIAQKISYAQTNKLGGIFAWNLQQDTTNATLLSAFPAPAAGYTNVTGSVSVSAPNGLAYNKIKHTGSETLTIVNISNQTISGPIELVISGLPSGVTAANNTGMFNGNPYWTVTANSLAAGTPVQLTMTLSYMTGATFTIMPTVYSGKFQ